jgi:hypothetical protein
VIVTGSRHPPTKVVAFDVCSGEVHLEHGSLLWIISKLAQPHAQLASGAPGAISFNTSDLSSLQTAKCSMRLLNVIM